MSQCYFNWVGGMWHGQECPAPAVTVVLMDKLPLLLMMGKIDLYHKIDLYQSQVMQSLI